MTDEARVPPDGRRIQRWIASLATAWPLPVGPGTELARACSFVGLDVDGDEVAAASLTLGSAVGVVGFAAALSRAAGSVGSTATALSLSLLAGVAAGGAVVVAGRRGPAVVAAVVRTRAVADATALVGVVSLSLRLSPVPERAVRAAIARGDGPLHDSLGRHADRAAAAGNPDAGLRSFAEEWREWFPALERSAALLLAAVDAEPGEDRTRLLDRALAAVEEDLRDRTASFAGDLRGPVTGLYAFGVLLPLALVGTLPAAVAAGVPLPPAAFVVVYDLLLPVGVAVVGGRLLLRRPVAFPPPAVGPTHPESADRRREAVAGGAAAAVAGWAVASVAVAGWAAPVVAAGLGVGTSLVVVSRPAYAVRRTVEERERGLADALALLGRRVADGESVERALPAVAGALAGATGAALSTAVRRRRDLGVTVRTALAGDGGPFGPGRATGARADAAVSAVAVAAAEGRPAGEALVAHAERLDDLAECERAARRTLATVTRTLRETAALFGPLVGGATVALAGRLDGLGGSNGSGTLAGASAGAAALDPALVGPTVGVYVLALAVVLTTLATGLERGVDATLVGYRVGIALVTATGAFVAGHLAVAMLIG